MKNSGNRYGLSTNTDTHMIKNSEWGAVAYLSHSKYGTCTSGSCVEVSINNSSSYITGRSAGVPGSSSVSASSEGTYTYEKENGVKASTTSNIYGVYDMSGGAYDYVMSNLVSNDGIVMISGYTSSQNSGYSGKVYDSGKYTSYIGIAYPNVKYYDKYSFSASSITRIRSKLGDAIKEIYSNGNYGWHNDYSAMVSFYPWFNRGGSGSSGSNAGIFHSGDHYGSSDSKYSTRLIIVS